jgi:type IV secretion system protein VirB8
MKPIGNLSVSKKSTRTSNTPQPPEAVARTEARTEREVGQWYLQQAREFEARREDLDAGRYRLLVKVASGFAVLAVVSVCGIVLLALLKRPNPPAVLVDNTVTGAVTVLPTTSSGKVTWSEKNDRSDLRKYVEARESYDWETINDMHYLVMLMSSPHEKAIYDDWVREASGPLKQYKDHTRVIARVGPITFVGDTAQVFFSKTFKSTNPGTPAKTEYYVATVAYNHDDVAESTKDQDLDSTEYRTLSYRVDRDYDRAPVDGNAAAGGASRTPSPEVE